MENDLFSVATASLGFFILLMIRHLLMTVGRRKAVKSHIRVRRVVLGDKPLRPGADRVDFDRPHWESFSRPYGTLYFGSKGTSFHDE
jgi:hypothetical protein